jgi:AcrR family transcriptional regulator
MPASNKSKKRSVPPAERILLVATALFARHGFNGTTTRMIAEKARMNEAIIFRHFPSKRQLYAEILKSKIREDFILRDVDAPGGPLDLETLLRVLAQRVLTSIRSDPDFLRLLYYSGLERHKLAASFYETYTKNLNSFLSAKIKDAMSRNELRKMDAMLASRTFFGMVAHMGMMGELFGIKAEPWQDEEKIDAYVSVFLNGLRKPKTAVVKKKSVK